jgi:hypothetical protein
LQPAIVRAQATGRSDKAPFPRWIVSRDQFDGLTPVLSNSSAMSCCPLPLA